MKKELVEKLKELLGHDIAEVKRDVLNLQKEYKKIWTQEVEKAKQEFIDDGGKSAEFEYHKQAEDIEFENLIEKFTKLKKEIDDKNASEEAKNLLLRKEIVAKIKDLVHSENVGAAVRKLHELQTQWKECGAVSTHKYKELQSEYSHAIEEIHYTLKIFRDLQEHDLKKNFELKSELIQKLKGLQNLENIRDAERMIKVYRNEWEEIGPVPHLKWDELKKEYRAALDETYVKIKSHYKNLEERKENNLKLKEELILKAKVIIDSSKKGKAAQWNKSTEEITALQNEWKTIGRTSEKDNERIWSEFKAAVNDFYNHKKEFFNSLHEKHSANRKIKNELITKAEALQSSTDWQNTGKELIKLQDTWKKYPSDGDREEYSMFMKFRAACNHFFEAKKNHFAGMEAEFEQNLLTKENILKRMNETPLSEDANENREMLKNFQAEWNLSGQVPIKEKKRIYDSYYAGLDALYDRMKMDKTEKNVIRYKNKIERLVHAENGFEFLNKESEFLKKNIQEVNNILKTYENNLGFFKSAKGNNPFLHGVNQKIEIEKAKLAELNSKRKLVNEELGKLREKK